ncbi:MAG: ribonuclease P protein component 4, partial [Halobacteriota archaeon]
MTLSQREIARERIETLFDLAADADVEDATRYVGRAREVSERTRVAVPGHLKARVCDGCEVYLRPGDTARVRLRSARRHVVVRCLECGHTNRRPYG